MEVIQVFDRPAFRSCYTVAGRFLFVDVLDHRLAQLIESLFAGWQLTPVPAAPERDIAIRFYSAGSANIANIEPEIPPTLNRFDIADGGTCYTVADGYYLRFDNSLMRLRQSVPVEVDVWVREVPESADAELARVTSFAVCAALRRFGLFDLHSAAVVEPSGKGVLIVGSSGSGKSTLTYQLAAAGWSYLSDDEVLLSLNHGGVEARGFRSFFAMRDVASRDFKSVFEPAAVFSSTRTPHVVPARILFTSVSGKSKTRIHPLTQSETMIRLIRACPWATYDTTVAGANLDLLSRLARQAKGFALLAGKDLLEPGRAAELLTQN
ncbi:MAG TPA: hypothetical protein VFS76_03460 [Pyrinomonadaceae bacterium]|nr:hypothetical protein [Pyrinomonadaceae bacterium]